MQLPSIMAIKKQKDEIKSKKQFEKELMSEMEDVVNKLSEISSTFDLVAEDELIEAIIYQEMALKSHYAYLLKLAKENNISCKLSNRRKEESNVVN